MNVIELKNVTKQFDEFVAVRDLSLEVRQGTIFGLLGPNGAGKTTSIRMIVNITAPDEGEVLVMGKHVSPELQPYIGYLPEERGLYKKMKVIDQLVFFANLKGLRSSEAAKRADQWLARLEMSDWRNKKPTDLSKGMQQKIQFIVTVIHDPEVLILDEPFSGLDPVSVNMLKTVILDLKQHGKTIIFSTHQMEQVEQMCDDICLVNHGTQVLSGSLREVKRRYGKNTVIMDYEGADSFLGDDLVKRHSSFSNYSEILLNEGADAQEVLRRALAAGARVNRFELVEPSLNEIFIEVITGESKTAAQAAESRG
ncbi:MAG TPA: ATP-binding cassette domain-containing protein [Blastocatellia bacterium]|jgi:ABC-2 type transport system ATP-binding protein|nr:ATP-binding cassette domain-containing protein [Blastocatellia bacterium]